MASIGRRTARRSAWLLPLVALLAAASGCSFVFVRPSAVTPAATADCTDSDGWPIFDTAAAVLAGAATVYATQRHYDEPLGAQGTLQREDAVISGAVATAFFVGSAAAGFSRVSGCREAKGAAAPPVNVATR